MDMSLSHIDTNFSPELYNAWDSAIATGRWNNTYARSAMKEYWAEGVQTYFNVGRPGPVNGNGINNDVYTRDRLKVYDTPLFALLDRVFRGAFLRS